MDIDGAVDIASTTTLNDDVTFTGANYNVVWDKSDNALEFADNAKAKFGTGGDLEIYHNGSHSVIQDAGTGNLQIVASTVMWRNSANNEFIAKGVENGAVELYYDNSKKLETTSTGILITGDIVFSGSGDGINLGVTSNTDSNTLEDYEEGTWEATTNANLGLTSGSNTGSYTKIGDICHARLYMRVASVSGTNHLFFSLHFTSAANTATDSYNAEAVGHIAQWQCSFGTGHIFCKVGNGSSTLYTYTSGNDADWAIITNSSIDTASQMAINITYRTA